MLLLALLAVDTLTNGGGDVKGGLANKVAGFFDYLIGQVPNWIAGLLLFIATIAFAKIAKSAVESRLSDRIDEEHQEVLVLSGRVTYFGILAVGITVALKIAGIDLTTILAAVAFGIGFAMRDLIMNFLAGVIILLNRQFTIGDFIQVGSTKGRVMEIQTRATILKTFDGLKVIVPNAEIFSKQVTSFTTNPVRRIVIPLYVSYDSDISYAIKIALEVIKKHPKVLKKPAPNVILAEYGDSMLTLSSRFWVGSRDGLVKIKSELMHKLWVAFNEAGIEVPYNILHVETNQDTAAYSKEAQARAQKNKAETKSEPVVQESPAPAVVSANGAAPSPNGTSTLVAAVAPVPVQTDGEVQDLSEIDAMG